MMNSERVDTIIRYALTCASLEDDFRDRELGPIHLVKYLYLGDLAYAESHEGETFTGIEWIFYNFGPWDTQAYLQIDRATQSFPYTKRVFSTKNDQEGSRYSIRSNPQEVQALNLRLERELPHVVVSKVKRSVRKYGSDTYGLLNDVYTTEPMRDAKPHDFLKFEGKPKVIPKQAKQETPKVSVRQQKRLQTRRDAIKEKYRQATKARLKQEAEKPKIEIQQDDVFFEGLQWLESLGGEPIESMQGSLSFSDDVWASDIRRWDEVP